MFHCASCEIQKQNNVARPFCTIRTIRQGFLWGGLPRGDGTRQAKDLPELGRCWKCRKFPPLVSGSDTTGDQKCQVPGSTLKRRVWARNSLKERIELAVLAKMTK